MAHLPTPISIAYAALFGSGRLPAFERRPSAGLWLQLKACAGDADGSLNQLPDWLWSVARSRLPPALRGNVERRHLDHRLDAFQTRNLGGLFPSARENYSQTLSRAEAAAAQISCRKSIAVPLRFQAAVPSLSSTTVKLPAMSSFSANFLSLGSVLAFLRSV